MLLLHYSFYPIHAGCISYTVSRVWETSFMQHRHAICPSIPCSRVQQTYMQIQLHARHNTTFNPRVRASKQTKTFTRETTYLFFFACLAHHITDSYTREIYYVLCSACFDCILNVVLTRDLIFSYSSACLTNSLTFFCTRILSDPADLACQGSYSKWHGHATCPTLIKASK